RDFRKSEIEHLHCSVGFDFDVAGLQIAVNDSFIVGGFQSVDDLARVTKSSFQRQRACGRFSLHQLHHQIIWTYIVDMPNIRMVQRRNGWGLAIEALRELRGRYFDGDFSSKPWIECAVDFTHPASADERTNLVRSQVGPGCQRHGGDSTGSFSTYEAR